MIDESSAIGIYESTNYTDGTTLLSLLDTLSEEAVALKLIPTPICDKLRYFDVKLGKLKRGSLNLAQALESKMERSPLGLCFRACTYSFIKCMLTALYMKVAFVPLDPSSSSLERLNMACKKAGVRIILCDVTTSGSANQLCSIDTGLKMEVMTISLDELSPNWSNSNSSASNFYDESGVVRSTQERELSIAMYLLSTSGSTGDVKMVAGTELSVLNRCKWQCTIYPYTSDEVAIARTNISFVDFIAEVFVPLCSGVPICVPMNPNPHLQAGIGVDWSNPWRDPYVLLNTIQELKVTRLVVTPTYLKELLKMESFSDNVQSLKYLHCSGEPLPVDLANRLLGQAPSDLKFINLYGSTETGADATYELVTTELVANLMNSSSNHLHVPCSIPLTNCEIRLLEVKESKDKEKEDIYSNTTSGEIYVMGSTVASGYVDVHSGGNNNVYDNEFALSGMLNGSGNGNNVFGWMVEDKQNLGVYKKCGMNNQTLTAEVKRYFRTGDVGKWVDGRLYVMGRADQIVKVRGISISLLEVETSIMRINEQQASQLIKNVVALAIPYNDSTLLCVLIELEVAATREIDIRTTEKEKEIEIYKIIRTSWEGRLSETLTPQRVFFSDNTFLLASGKVDRNVALDYVLQNLNDERSKRILNINMTVDAATAGWDLGLRDGSDQNQNLYDSNFKLEFDGDNLDWGIEPVTAWITRIFMVLLETPYPINADSDFFYCGGSSLTAIQLVYYIRNSVTKFHSIQKLEVSLHGFSLLQCIERLRTPEKIAILLTSDKPCFISPKEEEGESGIGSRSLSPPYTYIIQPLRYDDVEEATDLITESFCHREPLTSSLLRLSDPNSKCISRFRHILMMFCKDCATTNAVARNDADDESSEIGFSYIARDMTTKKLIAVSLASPFSHIEKKRFNCLFSDMIYTSCLQMIDLISTCPTSMYHSLYKPSCSLSCSSYMHPALPELESLDILYGIVLDNWINWNGDCSSIRSAQTESSRSVHRLDRYLQIHTSAGVETCVNAKVTEALFACEKAIIEKAERLKYTNVFTMNSGEVMRYIANENGMHSRISVNIFDTMEQLGGSKMKSDIQKLQSTGLVNCKTTISLYEVGLGSRKRFCLTKTSSSKANAYTQYVDLQDPKCDEIAKEVTLMVEECFFYFRKDDIRREMRHLYERDVHALILRENKGDSSPSSKSNLVGTAVLYHHHHINISGAGDNDKPKHPPPNIELLFLCITPNHRGRGGAKCLMKKLITEGEQRGWGCIHLFARDQFHEMYSSLGFHRVNLSVSNTSDPYDCVHNVHDIMPMSFRDKKIISIESIWKLILDDEDEFDRTQRSLGISISYLYVYYFR